MHPGPRSTLWEVEPSPTGGTSGSPPQLTAQTFPKPQFPPWASPSRDILLKRLVLSSWQGLKYYTPLKNVSASPTNPKIETRSVREGLPFYQCDHEPDDGPTRLSYSILKTTMPGGETEAQKAYALCPAKFVRPLTIVPCCSTRI